MTNKKRVMVAVLIVTLAVVLVLGGIEAFVANPRADGDGSYTQVASSIRAPPFANASNGQITLKVNSVNDASNATTSDAWIRATNEDGAQQLMSLAPPQGEKYLVVNITVANAQRTPVPFSDTRFFLVDTRGTTYYSNFAVCDRGCSAEVLHNRTLSDSYTTGIYVLFAVPTTAVASKLVYASDPQIVLALI
jgi:hypothetical protein